MSGAIEIDPDDDWPLCGEGIHDFEDYDHPDGSIRRACRDCGEPDDPEIIAPAPEARTQRGGYEAWARTAGRSCR